MTKLIELHTIVKDILEHDSDARNNDMHLIVKVYDQRIDTNMSFRNIVSNRKDFNLPSFESITRCRRKVQEQFPHLRATDVVQELRKEQYTEHKCYAMDIEYEGETNDNQIKLF